MGFTCTAPDSIRAANRNFLAVQVKPFLRQIMGDLSGKVLKVAQCHASDFLKRRWPQRWVGKPILSIDICVAGLIEIGAISEEVVSLSTKRLALIHWMLGRISTKGDANFPSNDHGFYRSAAWRRIRYSILRQEGASCVLCGKARSDGAVLHVDHIKPRSKYPELALDPSNLRVLFEDCNIGKGVTEE